MAAAQDVAVEDHVQVLVGGDPDHDLVGDRVLGVAARVPVRDPRRELLERDVGEPAERVGRVVVVALLELGHPAALEQDRVDVAGDRQVVAQDDRVAALLGGPAPDPVDPRPVAASRTSRGSGGGTRAGCPRSGGRPRTRSGRRRSAAAGRASRAPCRSRGRAGTGCSRGGTTPGRPSRGGRTGGPPRARARWSSARSS